MDKALVLGTKDCRFESCQGHLSLCCMRPRVVARQHAAVAGAAKAPGSVKGVTPCGTRTRNLRIRSPTPCPLSQGGQWSIAGVRVVRILGVHTGGARRRLSFALPSGKTFTPLSPRPHTGVISATRREASKLLIFALPSGKTFTPLSSGPRTGVISATLVLGELLRLGQQFLSRPYSLHVLY